MNSDLIPWRIQQLIAILRCRPFLKCPFCDGAGGAIEGYYEPEWCECRSCWRHWEPLDDRGMSWFVGRLPVMAWLRAVLSVRAKMDGLMPFTVLIRCKTGLHCDWIQADPETQVCNACFESRCSTDKEG